MKENTKFKKFYEVKKLVNRRTRRYEKEKYYVILNLIN